MKDYVNTSVPEGRSSIRAFVYVITFPALLTSLSIVGMNEIFVIETIAFFGLYYALQCVCRTLYLDILYVIKGQA